MRIGLVLLPLAICAAPALAQPAPVQPQLPAELTDPATTDRLINALEPLTKALLELPVGEVRAALEGRSPTAADRRATVRSETRMSERELKARIEAAKPALQQGMKAMAQALPQMMQSLAGVQESLDRAMANLPDPNYPKR